MATDDNDDDDDDDDTHSCLAASPYERLRAYDERSYRANYLYRLRFGAVDIWFGYCY